MPFYINSNSFQTNEERSGLIIEHDDNAFGNTLLLSLAIEIFSMLIDYMVDK